jgi:hypothetical protein
MLNVHCALEHHLCKATLKSKLSIVFRWGNIGLLIISFFFQKFPVAFVKEMDYFYAVNQGKSSFNNFRRSILVFAWLKIPRPLPNPPPPLPANPGNKKYLSVVPEIFLKNIIYSRKIDQKASLCILAAHVEKNTF